MSNPRKSRDLPMTESMKIRHYIMDILYHGGKRPVKLLSIRMLAAKFGVACSTVTLTLDKLEREGFVTARHGVGVFTNPQGGTGWGEPLPLVGIVVGYGKHFFYGAELWRPLAYLGLELTAENFNVRHLQLFGLSEEAIFEELKNAYLDGLVWMESDEVTEGLLERLSGAGIAVATMNIGFPGVNDVSYEGTDSIQDACRAVAAMMVRLVKGDDRRIEHLRVGTNVSSS